MTLMKFEDFYPDYRDMSFDNGMGMEDIKKFDVYARDNDKIGSVHDVLVDAQTGQFRYYIVDTGFWIFGKKVLMPVGLGRLDTSQNRIYVDGLTKDQVETLPNFESLDKVDFEHEERVRGTYRPMAATAGASAMPAAMPAQYDRNTYRYDQEPGLFGLGNRNNDAIRLYEERLIADKHRQKTGEVTVGKHVETERARASVPVEKERIVVERTSPTGQKAVAPGEADFREGEVARMEVYEETPDIRKEAYVREEVNVRKVTDRDVVNADETIRREELDLDTEGRPTIDRNRDRNRNPR